MPYKKKKKAVKGNMNKVNTKSAWPIIPLAKIHVLQCKNKTGKRHQHIGKVLNFYNDVPSQVQCKKGVRHFKRHKANLEKGFYSNPKRKTYFIDSTGVIPNINVEHHTIYLPSKKQKSEWKILDNFDETKFVTKNGSNKDSDVFVCALLNRDDAKSNKEKWESFSQILQEGIKIHPDQSQGNSCQGVCKKYVYYGKHCRFDKEGTISDYVSSPNVSQQVEDACCEELRKVVEHLEKKAKDLLDSIMPGEHECFMSMKENFQVGLAFDGINGFATQMALGVEYISPAHKDTDAFYSVLSASAPPGSNETVHDTILHYFVFPSVKVLVPLRTGDILLFNPLIDHCCSNYMIPNAMIYSIYVGHKTVLQSAREAYGDDFDFRLSKNVS